MGRFSCDRIRPGGRLTVKYRNPVDHPANQYENASRAVRIRDDRSFWSDRSLCVPAVNPKVADLAPADSMLTEYDEQHAVTYARLLDAEADNADWREIAHIVLQIDPAIEPDRARKAFESHLARAKWVARHGYRDLLRRGSPSGKT
jgi:hypothetical protein